MTKTHRDLLIPFPMTEKTTAWRMVDHPHTVIGDRRGFEVRIYHGPEWPEPYYVTMIAQQDGWLMDGATVPTEAAAQAEAIAMLKSLDGDIPRMGTA
jgi:hypothetical protein